MRHAAAINEKFFCENIFLVSKDDSLKSDDDLQVFFLQKCLKRRHDIQHNDFQHKELDCNTQHERHS